MGSQVLSTIHILLDILCHFKALSSIDVGRSNINVFLLI